MPHMPASPSWNLLFHRSRFLSHLNQPSIQTQSLYAAGQGTPSGTRLVGLAGRPLFSTLSCAPFFQEEDHMFSSFLVFEATPPTGSFQKISPSSPKMVSEK